MDYNEGIYLIHTRELRSLNEITYKIGRSYDLDVRITQYPKKSKIIFAINCENSVLCERELMKIFKSKFIQKLDYGTEYFEGDKKEMIKEIYNFINNINTDNIIKNKIIKKKNKKKIIDKEIIKKEIIEKDIKLNRTCPTCKYTFEYPSRLKKHFENVIHCKKSELEIKDFFLQINNNIVIIKCDICNKEFSRKDSLNRHIQNLKCHKPQI
jgi:hypothetical protein